MLWRRIKAAWAGFWHPHVTLDAIMTTLTPDQARELAALWEQGAGAKPRVDDPAVPVIVLPEAVPKSPGKALSCPADELLRPGRGEALPSPRRALMAGKLKAMGQAHRQAEQRPNEHSSQDSPPSAENEPPAPSG